MIDLGVQQVSLAARSHMMIVGPPQESVPTPTLRSHRVPAGGLGCHRAGRSMGNHATAMVTGMGFDGKYGRVTTEFGDIPDTEPVLVFRAQDKLLPSVLAEYYELAERAGSPGKHLDLIMDARDRVIAWQAENFTKVPNSERHDYDGLRPLPGE